MRLILMRHAKSSWGTASLPDHDRPLNGRGRRSAAALGDWLRARGYLPDHVLCSTALRTRETLAGLGLDAPVDYLPSLYLAEPEALLAAVRAAHGHTVLVLAHNPGIAECAALMTPQAPDHPRFSDYPTGATLVIDLPAQGWAALRPGTGMAKDFIVPRDLTEG